MRKVLLTIAFVWSLVVTLLIMADRMPLVAGIPALSVMIYLAGSKD